MNARSETGTSFAVRRAAAALVAALLTTAAGCGTNSAAPAALDGTWPEQPGDYRAVHGEWTRHGVLRKYPVQVLEVFATFKAPAWRAAHAHHSADVQGLTPVAREALLAREREASEGPYEVTLLVTTHDRRENDFTKGERAAWQVALVDGDGNEISPTSIQRDRRPRAVIKAEFPDYGDFAEAYVAHFPRERELLGAEAKQVMLRVSSTRGKVELIWQGS
ncbi:hypothetical protein [Haliangium sp.]|uniref:hypothetical protein n=1 Tax=Haliangium sp. TaxID=2663208 RepID=UPI003D0AA9DB